MEGKELVVLEKALVFLCSRLEQLTHATTLPRYGTGLSSKFICLSAGSLTTILWSVGPQNPGCRQFVGNSK
jgi:hypothetical protein